MTLEERARGLTQAGTKVQFKQKEKNFTLVNTLHILWALAESAPKILHPHLLSISCIHKGHANTKHFQESTFLLESVSFI